MNEFKEVYQTAMQDMKEYHMDALSCLDKSRHNKRVQKQVKRMVVQVFPVVCLVLICGFYMTQRPGEAVTYYAEQSAADQSLESVPAPALAMAETAETAETAEEGSAPALAMANTAEEESALVPQEDSAMPQVETSSVLPESAKEMAKEKQDMYVYDSFEQFQAEQTVLFPRPGAALLEHPKSTQITVTDNRITVQYDLEERMLYMESTLEETARAYQGEATSAKTYQTGQGYRYTLAEGAVTKAGIKRTQYATVTVGNHSIFIDFYGFSDKETAEILESIDLSLYE